MVQSSYPAQAAPSHFHSSGLLQAAQGIKETVAFAVNTKSSGVKGLQNSVAAKVGALDALIGLALDGHAIGYEALQILCYRNILNSQTLVEKGLGEIGLSCDRLAQLTEPNKPFTPHCFSVTDMVDRILSSSMELQCAMCFLLTVRASLPPPITPFHPHTHSIGHSGFQRRVPQSYDGCGAGAQAC
jgi:hypothetical protein